MAVMSSAQSRDRRARRTRRLLQEALLELLAEEPLSKLTISQITARADVSRQAFYLHFSSKEELLLSYVDDVFDAVRAAVLSSVSRRDGVMGLLKRTYTQWAANADALALALQIEDKDRLIERFRIHILDLMRVFSDIVPHESEGLPPREYAADFIAGGVYMLMRSWSRDGLTVPVVQMAELTYALIGLPVEPPGTGPHRRPGR